jgi:hypothetical protein
VASRADAIAVGGTSYSIWRVILASAVGTMIYVCMFMAPSPPISWKLFQPRSATHRCPCPITFGNGVFGGLLPLIGLAVCAKTGNIYAGLYYPMIVASVTFVIGNLVLKETHGTKIWDEVGGMR